MDTTSSNRVRAGIFSFTPSTPQDDAYLRWHLLDHMPEQYQLPGIALGQRWRADAGCREARLAAEGPWADLAHVVCYLVGDPVPATLDGFVALGQRLASEGRMPIPRPSLGLSMLALQGWHAAESARVSAAVVPFRPHRGVLLLLEPLREPSRAVWATDEIDELLDLDGVAGLWAFEPPARWSPPTLAGRHALTVTVLYLDADPVGTTQAAAQLLRARWHREGIEPLFAGPLRSSTSHEAWA